MDMRSLKRLGAFALAAAMIFTLAACGQDEPAPDPHEGMVYVNTGANKEWITPAAGVAAPSTGWPARCGRWALTMCSTPATPPT